MVIYADVIFAVNFAMDAFILWMASKLLRLRLSPPRCISAAAIGALSYVALLVSGINANGFLLSEALIALNILICFFPKRPAEWLNQFIAVNICSFAAGGLCVVIFYFAGAEGYSGTLRLNTGGYTLKLLACSTAAAYIALKLFLAKTRGRALRKQKYYLLRVHINGESVETNALVDTGNNLSEPITKTPVIIAEAEVFKELLPADFMERFKNGEADLSHFCDIKGSIFENRLRLIPFSALGKKNGLLVGLRPDKVELADGGRPACQTVAIIGLYSERLCEDGHYRALINPDCINNNTYRGDKT